MADVLLKKGKKKKKETAKKNITILSSLQISNPNF